MSDLQQYIVEEWAEEYREGRLHRREFLRRIAIMAGGAALAAPILKALGVAASAGEVAEAAATAPTPGAAPTGVTVPPDDPAIQASMVAFQQGGVTVHAYLARPRGGGQVPGVIVVHENRGLLEHFKDISRRYAKAGYAALAVDLASPAGGTARFSDPAEVSGVLGRTPPEQLVAMLTAGVTFLRGVSNVRRDRIGATGFCFGGGMTWRLATQAELRAAAPFYGSNPPLEDIPKIKAAVLAIYGALDERLNAGIPAVRDAMQKANVVHEIVIYPNANHAFFNDTGERHNAQAAQQAWTRVLGWFERYLKAA